MAAPLRDRLLDAAEELVLTSGFSATTVDAVLRRAGASKGAFFHHFPTKAALGLALVERYAARDAAVLDEALAAAEAATDDPAAQLVSFVRHFEDAARSAEAHPTTAPPACLLVSFIYERELADRDTDEVVRSSVLHWRERILSKLEAAAAGRTLPASVDLPSLADHWFTVFEGSFLLAAAVDDPTALARQLAHLRIYLELLFAPDARPRRGPLRRSRQSA